MHPVTRRSFHAAAASALARAAFPARAARPNLIFILADDRGNAGTGYVITMFWRLAAAKGGTERSRR